MSGVSSVSSHPVLIKSKPSPSISLSLPRLPEVKGFIPLKDHDEKSSLPDSKYGNLIYTISGSPPQRGAIRPKDQSKEDLPSKEVKIGKVTLLPYQVKHFYRIMEILDHQPAYLDTSNMGLGKSELAKLVALERKLSVVVICPLSIMGAWKTKCQEYNLPLKDILTYQKLRGTIRQKSKMTTLNHKLLTCDEEGAYHSTDYFQELVRQGILLVFDEIVYIKNQTAQLSAAFALVQGLMKEQSSSRIALLSALPGESDTNVESILKMLGIIKHDKLYHYNPKTYAYELLGMNDVITKCRELNPQETDRLVKNIIINKHTIYPLCLNLFSSILKHEYLSSMTKTFSLCADIKNGFYNISTQNMEILSHGLKFLELYAQGQRKQDGHRSMILLEWARLPTFYRLAVHTLNKYPQDKVIIYLNYTKHLNLLYQALSSYRPLLFYGKTKNEERVKILEKFQSPNNEYRLLIINLLAGGIGLDLDDTDGRFRRWVFINPSYFFNAIHQTTGRTTRPLTKSQAINRFVYTKNCPEELKILDALCRKSEKARNILYDASDIVFPDDYPSVYEEDDEIDLPFPEFSPSPEYVEEDEEELN